MLVTVTSFTVQTKSIEFCDSKRRERERERQDYRVSAKYIHRRTREKKSRISWKVFFVCYIIIILSICTVNVKLLSSSKDGRLFHFRSGICCWGVRCFSFLSSFVRFSSHRLSFTSSFIITLRIYISIHILFIVAYCCVL